MSSRLFTCFHSIHIKKTAPLPGAHVFSLITTICKLVRDIHITNEKDPPPGGHVFFIDPNHFQTQLSYPGVETHVLTKFHEDWATELNNIKKRPLYNITRVLTRKNAPPPCGHVFQPTGIIFTLVQDINGMNLLTKFHKDRTINVASRVKNAPPLGSHVFQAKVTIFELIQDIIGTNLLCKFHDDRKINVTSRVLTRFYYSHIRKYAPPPGGHVFQPTSIIF
ncbi:hypothetical protein DPMN_053997 [Dreissena polymorpha]|uniref:Uncharacterized protein n=1 Tax=Dreissena polymorpha TaxID=45954 RepID=A0A9D4HR76_DREPO|nr:hypothetical protein DPMN_053997 [Dreissena polymorpha]